MSLLICSAVTAFWLQGWGCKVFPLVVDLGPEACAHCSPLPLWLFASPGLFAYTPAAGDFIGRVAVVAFWRRAAAVPVAAPEAWLFSLYTL